MLARTSTPSPKESILLFRLLRPVVPLLLRQIPITATAKADLTSDLVGTPAALACAIEQHPNRTNAWPGHILSIAAPDESQAHIDGVNAGKVGLTFVLRPGRHGRRWAGGGGAKLAPDGGIARQGNVVSAVQNIGWTDDAGGRGFGYF